MRWPMSDTSTQIRPQATTVHVQDENPVDTVPSHSEAPLWRLSLLATASIVLLLAAIGIDVVVRINTSQQLVRVEQISRHLETHFQLRASVVEVLAAVRSEQTGNLVEQLTLKLQNLRHIDGQLGNSEGLPSPELPMHRMIQQQLDAHVRVLGQIVDGSEPWQSTNRLTLIARLDSSSSALISSLNVEESRLRLARGSAFDALGQLGRMASWLTPAIIALVLLSGLAVAAIWRRRMRASTARNTALQASNGKLDAALRRNNLLLNAAHTGVAVLDAKGLVQAHNEMFANLMTGHCNAEQLQHRPLFELLDQSATFGALAQALKLSFEPSTGLQHANNAAWSMDIELLHGREADQSTWVQCTIVRPTQSQEVALTLQDVSRLKLSELANRKLAQDASAVVDQLPIAVVRTDLNGNIIGTNHRAEQMFGSQAADVVGKQWQLRMSMAHMPPATIARVSRAEQRARLGEMTTDHGVELARNNGERFLANVTIAGLRDASGQVAQIAALIEEVTDTEWSTSNAGHHAKMQREALLRQAHHRIKNGLQGVVGLLARATARIMGEPAQVLGTATVQVLSLSAVHGVRAGNALAEVELQPLVEALASEIAMALHARIAVECDTDSLPAIVATSEAEAIALIIGELLTNAVKHGTWRGGHPQPTVRLRISADACSLTVSNPTEVAVHGGIMFNKIGHGLELSRALLPASGASLDIVEISDTVQACLILTPPVIRH
jgi:PAS domain S-box-containing protein